MKRTLFIGVLFLLAAGCRSRERIDVLRLQASVRQYRFADDSLPFSERSSDERRAALELRTFETVWVSDNTVRLESKIASRRAPGGALEESQSDLVLDGDLGFRWRLDGRTQELVDDDVVARDEQLRRRLDRLATYEEYLSSAAFRAHPDARLYLGSLELVDSGRSDRRRGRAARWVRLAAEPGVIWDVLVEEESASRRELEAERRILQALLSMDPEWAFEILRQVGRRPLKIVAQYLADAEGWTVIEISFFDRDRAR